jgi:N6-L-threonylcarbamoyladenine synthase
LEEAGKKHRWTVFVPPVSFTTDNAAMIAITGYFKYLNHDFCGLGEVPYARINYTF